MLVVGLADVLSLEVTHVDLASLTAFTLSRKISLDQLRVEDSLGADLVLLNLIRVPAIIVGVATETFEES